MTKDEALKMAIKELSQTALGDTPALKACREALEQEPLNLNCKSVQKRLATQWGYIEQPAQDFFERGKEIAKWADKQNEQPAQEPVAEVIEDKFADWSKPHVAVKWNKVDFEIGTKLYTHPAPSWQGLSNDMVRAIGEKCQEENRGILNWIDFYNAIESMLKDKNYE